MTLSTMCATVMPVWSKRPRRHRARPATKNRAAMTARGMTALVMIVPVMIGRATSSAAAIRPGSIRRSRIALPSVKPSPSRPSPGLPHPSCWPHRLPSLQPQPSHARRPAAVRPKSPLIPRPRRTVPRKSRANRAVWGLLEPDLCTRPRRPVTSAKCAGKRLTSPLGGPLILHRRPSCRRGFLRHEVLVLPLFAPTRGQSLPSDIVG